MQLLVKTYHSLSKMLKTFKVCIASSLVINKVTVAHAALSISLDSPEVQGREGDSVLVCANISGDIVLEIPVLAALTVNKTDELGKHKTWHSASKSNTDFT